MPWRDVNSPLQAQRVCKKALEMGYNPICWQIMYLELLDFSNIKNREIGLDNSLSFLDSCQEFWIFGAPNTPFMIKELSEATIKDIKIVEHSILDFLNNVK